MFVVVVRAVVALVDHFRKVFLHLALGLLLLLAARHINNLTGSDHHATFETHSALLHGKLLVNFTKLELCRKCLLKLVTTIRIVLGKLTAGGGWTGL